jgi:pyruvate,orthophosphate dikinase
MAMTRAIGDDAGPSRGPGSVALLDGESRLPREILGNKGFGINLMRSLGLPVPPAFCLTTEVCAALLAGQEHALDRVWPDVLDKLRWLEDETSRTFGRGPRPLLLSVRSGAAQSMPGMLDTVLDLGIDDAVDQALAMHTSAEFAADTRSRFEAMYRRIVLGEDSSAAVPDDPFVQLRGAVEAVFASWNSPRAVAYRAHHGLDGTGGTAVVVQAMVFGNHLRDSGTGVVFSRNPATGADAPLGEWLPGAQGEDVVSGTLDCLPLDALRTQQPGVFAELIAAADQLERLGRDVQDIEFTVEDGRLWLLQTRVAKRSPQAAVRLALKFRDAGLIDDAEALGRCCHPRCSPRPGSPQPYWPRGYPRALAWCRAPRTPTSMQHSTPLTRTRTSSWSARRPVPMTSPGCSRPARSSRRSVEPPPTPRWSVVRSAFPRWSGVVQGWRPRSTAG